MSLVLNATEFRDLWRLVSFARSNDPSRPILTAMWMEFHPLGVRLTASDAHLLLTAATDDAPDDYRSEGEVVCCDPGRVVSSFLDQLPPSLTIEVEHDADSVSFSSEGSRLTVPSVDGDPPLWRTFMDAALTPETGDGNLTFGPVTSERLLRLAASGDLWLEFTAKKMARIHFGPKRACLGFVMPIVP